MIRAKRKTTLLGELTIGVFYTTWDPEQALVCMRMVDVRHIADVKKKHRKLPVCWRFASNESFTLSKPTSRDTCKYVE